MDEAEDWSDVAEGWAQLWGAVAEPAWRAVVTAAGIGPGTRVLDVGCGTGDFLAHVAQLGAVAAGADPASGMVQIARHRAPGADVRHAWAHDLPWPARSVDVVTVFNTLHLVDDPRTALAEAARVTVPGGRIAVAGWAPGARGDLDVLHAAIAAADGEEPGSGEPSRSEDPAAVLTAAGLRVTGSGVVGVAWAVPDEATLVRGVLLGEDPATTAALGPTVVAAARPFRTPAGGYRLLDALRWAVGRTPAGTDVRGGPGAGRRTRVGGGAEAPPPT